jgi:hypothetical protein
MHLELHLRVHTRAEDFAVLSERIVSERDRGQHRARAVSSAEQ